MKRPGEHRQLFAWMWAFLLFALVLLTGCSPIVELHSTALRGSFPWEGSRSCSANQG
jgi:hypothetical protein